MKHFNLCVVFQLLNGLSVLSLFGLYVFLLELCRCQSQKWPPLQTRSQPLQVQSHLGGLLPQIHSPQTRLTVQVGDKVELPCKVFSLGESHVLWKHKDNVLAGSNVTTYADPRIKLLGDFTLKISDITRLDEGDYECLITSWPPQKLHHSVVVHDAPTISMETSTSIMVTEGDSVEIGCIPHGAPLPKVTWSMRDGNIPIHKSHLNQARLKMENVTRLYSGLYVCTAHNGVGRPAIGAVYLRVLFAPDIEIPRRRAHSGLGYRTQLVGVVHADPKPEVSWMKDEEEIKSNSDRVFMELYGRNEYRLVFNSVKEIDFATYTIQAKNKLGSDIKKIEFSGIPNDPILTRWEAVDNKGVEVTLFWAVECYSSVIDYKLYFRPAIIPSPQNEDSQPAWIQLTIPADKLLDPAASFLHTKSFTIRGLNISSIYEGAVKARNKFGWSQLSSVCYFATFPNSSSSKAEEMEKLLNKMKNGFKEFGFHLSKPSSTSKASETSSSGLSLKCTSWRKCTFLLALWMMAIYV